MAVNIKYNYINRTKEIDELKKHLDEIMPEENILLKKLKEQLRISFISGFSSLNKTKIKTILENSQTGNISDCEIKAVIAYSNIFDFLYGNENECNITENDIINLHKIFYENIDSENAGKYRKENIIITETGYKPPNYSTVPNLMYTLISLIPKMKKALHPIDFAAWLHLNLINISPFMEGNNICAVFLSNMALIKEGYCQFYIPSILKSDYYEALKRAQIEKEPDRLIAFISEMELEAMRDRIRLINTLSKKK